MGDVRLPFPANWQFAELLGHEQSVDYVRLANCTCDDYCFERRIIDEGWSREVFGGSYGILFS